MSKRKKVHIAIGDYPASYWQTPDEVKELLYDQQYRLLRAEEPFKWTNTATGETMIEDEPWDEKHLRSLAAGLVQAKLGWTKPGVLLSLSKKDAKSLKAAQNRPDVKKPEPPRLADAPPEIQQAFADADAAIIATAGATVDHLFVAGRGGKNRCRYAVVDPDVEPAFDKIPDWNFCGRLPSEHPDPADYSPFGRGDAGTTAITESDVKLLKGEPEVTPPKVDADLSSESKQRTPLISLDQGKTWHPHIDAALKAAGYSLTHVKLEGAGVDPLETYAGLPLGHFYEGARGKDMCLYDAFGSKRFCMRSSLEHREDTSKAEG